jgi:hypothetical protein
LRPLTGKDLEMKLFRSTKDDTRWLAFGPEAGWVMFPAEAGGWQKRLPVRGLDPPEVRQVPLHLGFNTGIPGAPTKASGTPRLRRRAAA